MANNCLVTKLKAVVNNPNLPELNTLQVTLTVANDPYFAIQWSNYKASGNKGNVKTADGEHTWTNVWGITTEDLTNISVGTVFKFNPKDELINVCMKECTEDISFIKYCTSLEKIFLRAGSRHFMTGDLDDALSGKNTMYQVDIQYQSRLTGTIAAIAGALNPNANQYSINVGSTSITGNLSVFENFTPSVASNLYVSGASGIKCSQATLATLRANNWTVTIDPGQMTD